MAKIAPKIISINRVHTKNTNLLPDEVLTKLASLILDGGGLINPLIVKRRGYEDYDLVDGDLQYFAAKRAAQIDPIHGESIDAYIIEEDNADVIQQQMGIFRSSSAPTPSPDIVTLSMRQLEKAIESATQPLLEKINSLEEMKNSLIKRMENDKQRYLKYYNIDCYDEMNYDLIIDSTNISQEEVANKIIDFIKLN